MKITFFCGSFSAGGAEKVAVNLANHYAGAGHRVQFLVLRETGPYREQLDTAVTVTSLECRARHSLGKIRQFLKNDDSDVILGVLRDVNIMLGLAATGLKKPIVFREANTLHATAQLPAWRRALYLAAMKLAYRKATRVICNSEDTQADLVNQRIIPPQKGTVIVNPVLPADLPVKLQGPSPHPWLKDDSLHVILNVGRLHPQKNQAMLVRAFARVHGANSHARLLILGSGELEAELLALAESLGVGRQVDIVAFVANPFPYYRDCTVFVLCSLYEGFGNVLAEAMACGAAIISTHCPGGPASILDNGKYGILVKNADENELTEKIQQVIHSKNQAVSDENEKGKKRANLYTVETVSNLYLKVLTPE